VAPHRLGLPFLFAKGQPRSAVVAAAQEPNVASDDAESRDRKLAAVSLAASLGGGLLLSSFGMDDSIPEWSRQASSALGWSYVLAWSISFYPQVGRPCSLAALPRVLLTSGYWAAGVAATPPQGCGRQAASTRAADCVKCVSVYVCGPSDRSIQHLLQLCDCGPHAV
jgi:hypothetical protein